MKIYRRKAQGATEYAIFIAAVLAGLLALQVYYNRAVKGNVKARADSVGEQLNTKSGNYTLEQRSVAARDSRVGNATGAGSWSKSTIRGGDSALNGTLSGQITSLTGTMAFDSGAYKGGEISSSQYVNEFGTVSHELGSSGIADLGQINTTDSVWNDSGL